MKPSRRRFSKDEYTNRQLRVCQAMAETGLELLIVSDPSNMCWLTGYDAWSFYVHQCLVMDTDGSLFWYGRGIDANGARLTTDLADDQIIAYPDDYVQSADRHPMNYLAGILKSKHQDKKHIGLEKDNYYFSARAAESLYHSLPGARFHDATALVNWQRAVKSEQEIQYMQAAGEIVESVYSHIMDVAEPGMRKNELAAEILYSTTKGTAAHYGDYAAIVPLIGAGEEASACHMTWDDEILQNNSSLSLELAGVHARYHCPCSRTLYFGKPPEKYRDIEKVINECIETTLEVFKPGNSCADVSNTFFSTLKKLGYEKHNRCGYPIGLSYPPDWGERTMSLRSDDTSLLKSNMTFHFMPAIWFDDWGFETTESVIVSEQGGQCLSNVPRKLLVKH